MRKSIYHRKKDNPIKEAVRRHSRTRTTQRLLKLSKEIAKKPQFQEELRQLKQNYPYPDECLKEKSVENINKLNTYIKEWDKFCKRWNVDSTWLRMFNKVVINRSFKILLRPKLEPITKDQFQREKLDFDRILPVLIKTGYVSNDMIFTMKSLRLDNKFKRHFPKYTKSQFCKIEEILKGSYKSIPSVEPTGPHTEQEYRDMEPLCTLHSYNRWGNPPIRSGRKKVFDRNCAMHKEYKKRRKKSENADDLINKLANQYQLSYETIRYIVLSKKFDR
jgi:hypothetical protein